MSRPPELQVLIPPKSEIPLLTDLPVNDVKTEHKKLDEIQGLRGIAIISVLLFHLWPFEYRAGFLGVDVFFVISGYLICMLLSKNPPLNLELIGNFYFRRLKRIIPLYLSVILLVFVSAWIFMSPTDFKDLYTGAKRPLAFIANWPQNAATDYFAKDQGHNVFWRHLWSLSVEIQFYLTAPFLVWILHRLRSSLQLTLIAFLAIISFLIQSNSENDYKHMALASRFWQFMAGFLVQNASDFGNNVEESGDQQKDTSDGTQLASYSLTILLIFSCAFPPTPDMQLNRLLVTIITALMLYQMDGNRILNCSVLLFIGNISYSVYLLHWPLQEWYKYLNPGLFVLSKEIPILDGILSLFIFIIAGYFFEKFFVYLNQKLTSWKHLLFTIVLLYSLTFVMISQLKKGFVNLEWDRNEPLPDRDLVWQKAIDFHEHFDRADILTRNESIELNKKFMLASVNPCRFEASPTNFNHSLMGDLQWSCVVRGNGTKTIVVTGNSHARSLFGGVIHHFKDQYKELTLMFKDGFDFLTPSDTAAKKYIEHGALLPALREWHTPIDIIVVGHAYPPELDPPIKRPIEEDEIYQIMSKFYGNLSQIAQEVVFVPTAHFDSGLQTYSRELTKAQWINRNFDVFRTQLKDSQEFMPNLRKRIETVNCPHCVKVDYIDVWCKQKEGVCDTIDQQRHLGYFYDRHHVNLYGSMFVGRYLRKKYDQWMEEHRNATI